LPDLEGGLAALVFSSGMAAAEHVSGPWLFNDAPREMRLQGVEKLPDLIKALAEKAPETTKRIQAKTKEVRALADAIRPATDETKRQPSNIEIIANAARLAAEQAPPSMNFAAVAAAARDSKKGAK